jgi:hypothetical protein
MNEAFKSKSNILRDNVLVSESDLCLIEKIEKELNEGKITETVALQQLQQLKPQFILSNEQADDEWEKLNRVIKDDQEQINKLAKSRFDLGGIALPICVLVIFVSLFFGWHKTDGALTIASIMGACLTAITTYSYFILRVHQQASLASERLSEKQVGLLFLRIAISIDNPEKSNKLIDAGTKMFLGHHVASTIPLNAQDRHAKPSKENRSKK